MLSFPFEGGSSINLYTILFILCFGIGYGAYYATADMPIPMVADCSDYETYRSGKYIPGIMGTMFSLVDKLVSSLAQTLVAFIFLLCAGMSELPTDSTPYSVGIKVAVIIMFCVIPMARVDCDARRHEGLQSDRRKDEGDSGCQRRAQEGDCLRHDPRAVHGNLQDPRGCRETVTPSPLHHFKSYKRSTLIYEEFFPLVWRQRSGNA